MTRTAVDALATDLLAGNRRALARACSLIESTTADDRSAAVVLLDMLLPHCIPSRRIGVTGSPGVGKSTFVEAFGLDCVHHGARVAVLAVDPSSRRTGGSILGDKVRMPTLSMHDRAFVRPSPSRLALGGATSTTREMILLCEAAGYDTVIVETVGVGQSEIDVADMVDLFLLLVLATAGDDVQGIKRGIMEVADAVVVTKSDLDEQAAQRAVAQYKGSLRFMVPSQPSWTVPTLRISSVAAAGLDAIRDVVDTFFADDRRLAIADRRHQQRVTWFDDTLHRSLIQLVEADTVMRRRLHELRDEVAIGNVVPSSAVRQFLSMLQLTTNTPPRI